MKIITNFNYIIGWSVRFLIVVGFTKRRVWFVEFANDVNVLNINHILIWMINLLYVYDFIKKKFYSYIDVTFRLCNVNRGSQVFTSSTGNYFY